MNETNFTKQLTELRTVIEALTPYSKTDSDPWNRSFDFISKLPNSQLGNLFRKFTFRDFAPPRQGMMIPTASNTRGNVIYSVAFAIIYPSMQNDEKLGRYMNADAFQIQKTILNPDNQLTGINKIDITSQDAQPLSDDTLAYIFNLEIDCEETIS